mmetsp:Transcript_35726/g.26071  ORF Transcript_35726/g.26071 Transcript_35726/m.26071 type:complete len:87 (+) Transcript_35726:1316-1576(+)
MYLFGGKDELGNPTNALFKLKPCKKINDTIIHQKNGSYKKLVKPQLTITAERVEADGIAPAPRFMHAACFHDKYLVIHGGKNNQMY